MDSDAIAEVRYDPAQRWLFVQFTSGEWYAYLDAPPDLYAAFLAAPSKGRFFQDAVRDRFAYRKLER